ncbi:MAG TPA: Tm-1-like ATP-binding domain-containing protein [Thermoleophilaceae bacterium]|nr:Tm-1-like ATP-binding domain-containing protein [Thermoleophilaceae bacterium]
MKAPVVAVVGSFDTKGAELRYLADAVRRHGARPLLLDCGVLGTPTVEVDVTADAIAERAGTSLGELRAANDRGAAVGALGRAVAGLLGELHDRGEVHGLVAAGGSNNATLFALAAEGLPFGAPKLLVSTVAAGDTRPYVNAADVGLLYPIVDIEGLNAVSRDVLRRAGAAIAAMAREASAAVEDDRNADVVAATMFGVTTPCVSAARELLEAGGDEVLVFHATGVGGQSFERLIDTGRVAAALDITTTELADEVVGGTLSAGPSRLEAAGRAGIPQVVSTGALDMANFGPMSTVPPALRDRRLYAHNENVTLMRIEPDESREIGRVLSEKVNRASGPVAVLLPLGGVSALDSPGAAFEYPESDAALFDAIRSGVDPSVELIESELHVNDPGFAELAVATLARLRATSTASTANRHEET